MKLMKTFIVFAGILLCVPCICIASIAEKPALVQLNDTMGLHDIMKPINKQLGNLNTSLRLTKFQFINSDENFDHYDYQTNNPDLYLDIRLNKGGRISSIGVVGKLDTSQDGQMSSIISSIADGVEATLMTFGASQKEAVICMKDSVNVMAENGKRALDEPSFVGFWCATANRAFLLRPDTYIRDDGTALVIYVIMACNVWEGM